VLAQGDALTQRVLDQVRDLPPGAARDQRAIEVLVDVALAHPGLIALLLAPVSELSAQASEPQTAGSNAALQAFGVDPGTADPERLVRVVGALAAVAVLTLAAHHENQTIAWRPFVVATCFDALGHGRPGAVPAHSDQVEA
jgi:hypothetical protein